MHRLLLLKVFYELHVRRTLNKLISPASLHSLRGCMRMNVFCSLCWPAEFCQSIAACLWQTVFSLLPMSRYSQTWDGSAHCCSLPQNTDCQTPDTHALKCLYSVCSTNHYWYKSHFTADCIISFLPINNHLIESWTIEFHRMGTVSF